CYSGNWVGSGLPQAVVLAGFRRRPIAQAESDRNMAASGLDHLKNDYRRRFCRPSRALDINTEKGENILEILQDCFEEQICTYDIHPKVLATDINSKNIPDSRKMSKKNKDTHHDKDKVEFYLSVGSPLVLLDAKAVSQNAGAQKKVTRTFENSVNLLSSSTEISLKTKKRLDFEDKDVLKEVENKISEIEDKISEGPQKGKPSGISQKRIQNSEYEIRPQVKKSFSTLFLETVKKKTECSPIVKHTATCPPHSSPASDKKLLEDEFVIDESDKSFANLSWITIPRKAASLKQRTIFPAEGTALQNNKSREKHHSVSSMTLRSDKDSGKVDSREKSQPSEQKKLSKSCALTDAMESNHRSKKCETDSENAEKLPQSKKTIRQKQRRKPTPNVFEEHVDMEQSKEKNLNMSHTILDKLQRNSDRNMEEGEEINVHTSVKQMQPMGSKQSSTRVPCIENQKKSKKPKKKYPSHGSKKNKLTPEESDSTLTRSRRISRRPSDWWVVKPGQSPVYSYSSVMNESLANHNSIRKSAEKTNQSSVNVGKKTISRKRQKRAKGSSRKMKFLSADNSGEIMNHDEISTCSQNDSLKIDKADLAEKKNLDCSGHTESSKKQDGTNTVQNVHLKSQRSGYTCKTMAESNLDSGETKTSVFEGSGPSTVKNVLITEKNNSDVDDKEVQEYPVLPSNTPNVRRTKRIRLKPLEYWRGERIDYQGRPSGGFVIGGILSPDTVPSKRKAKGNMEKVNKIVNRKRICLDTDERNNKLGINMNIPLGDPLQPTRVKDPETKEIVLMDLVRPRDTYQFFVAHDELKVYKTLDTPFFSTGKLTLGPHQEKGKQHVGSDMLVFYVDFGDLLCTLHETPYVITTGDSFYVP
ncbi:Centromere protein C, partial [Galemys pyrenaicus]